MTKKFNNSTEVLKEYGLQIYLIAKLDNDAASEIAQFALDHSLKANLSVILTQLASLEVSGKKGAAYLMRNNIANITQLKNLSITQIDDILSEYKLHHNLNLASKYVKYAIIDNQQSKLNDRRYDKIDIQRYSL